MIIQKFQFSTNEQFVKDYVEGFYHRPESSLDWRDQGYLKESIEGYGPNICKWIDKLKEKGIEIVELVRIYTPWKDSTGEYQEVMFIIELKATGYVEKEDIANEFWWDGISDGDNPVTWELFGVSNYKIVINESY